MRAELLRAYEHLARRAHEWDALPRARAMADLWRCAREVKRQEDQMPAWPHDTLQKLSDAGYKYQERGGCTSISCKTEIFWYITPKGKWMPFEQREDGTFQPHFASCPEARKFSRKSKDEVVPR